ncbi:hypothetical protein HI914_04432 [Erysiphe necator]|nr:hypothetical protein HI914_04432 [Erysiphe necator]
MPEINWKIAIEYNQDRGHLKTIFEYIISNIYYKQVDNEQYSHIFFWCKSSLCSEENNNF